MLKSRLSQFFTKPLSLLHVLLLVFVVSIFVWSSGVLEHSNDAVPTATSPQSTVDAGQAQLVKTRTLLARRLSGDFELQPIPDSSLIAVVMQDKLFFTDEDANVVIDGDVFVFSKNSSGMGYLVSDFLRLELKHAIEKRDLQTSGLASVSAFTQKRDLLALRADSRHIEPLSTAAPSDSAHAPSSVVTDQTPERASRSMVSTADPVEPQAPAVSRLKPTTQAPSRPVQEVLSSPEPQQAIVKAPTQIPPTSEQSQPVQSIASISEPSSSVDNNSNPVFGVSARALQNPLTYIQAEDLAERLTMTTDDLDMQCLQISYAATNYRELYSLFGTLNEHSEKLSKHCGQVYATHALAATGDRLMVVYKAPNERDVITIVSDYTCSYCLKMHKDIERLNADGITVRLYPYGRAAYSDGSGTPTVLARNYQSLLCREDQAERREIMDTLTSNPSYYNRTLIEPDANYSDDVCASYISETKIMGDIFVRGATPMVISKDRRSVHGYMDAASVSRWLNGEERTF